MRRDAMLAVFTVLAAVVTGGCQTLSHGTTQVITITSEPSGATAEIPGFGSKTTPAFFVVPRNRDQTVVITKDGYEPQTAVLVASLAPQRATPEPGVMSVIGSVVDVAAGGSWELTPDKLSVTLVAVKGAEVAKVETPKSDPVKGDEKAAVVIGATPPIVAKEKPVAGPATPVPASPNMAAATSYNLARLDHLLKEGLISKEEYEILRQIALTTGTIAGAGGAGQ